MVTSADPTFYEYTMADINFTQRRSAPNDTPQPSRKVRHPPPAPLDDRQAKVWHKQDMPRILIGVVIILIGYLGRVMWNMRQDSGLIGLDKN
jgi:hypothetical protein